MEIMRYDAKTCEFLFVTHNLLKRTTSFLNFAYFLKTESHVLSIFARHTRPTLDGWQETAGRGERVSEVLVAGNMSIIVFWVVMPCSIVSTETIETAYATTSEDF